MRSAIACYCPQIIEFPFREVVHRHVAVRGDQHPLWAARRQERSDQQHGGARLARARRALSTQRKG